MKFKGGKGLSTWAGFVFSALHSLNSPMNAAVLLVGFLIVRNRIWIWVASLGIIFPGMDLILFFMIMAIQINHDINLVINYRFRVMRILKDLLKPTIR